MLQWSVVCTLQFDRPSLAAGPASASIYFSAPLVLLWSCSPQEQTLFVSVDTEEVNQRRGAALDGHRACFKFPQSFCPHHRIAPDRGGRGTSVPLQSRACCAQLPTPITAHTQLCVRTHVTHDQRRSLIDPNSASHPTADTHRVSCQRATRCHTCTRNNKACFVRTDRACLSR